MTLTRFKSHNHPQQVAKRGANRLIDDRGTDPELFARLHRAYRFTLDVAAEPHNAKCARYFTPLMDGLVQAWAGDRVWCNPPYSDIRPWVEKAWRMADQAEIIVMLLPANRTEQPWWQELVEPKRDRSLVFRTHFLPGRPRFVLHGNGHEAIKPNERPPFGCVLLIWEKP